MLSCLKSNEMPHIDYPTPIDMSLSLTCMRLAVRVVGMEKDMERMEEDMERSEEERTRAEGRGVCPSTLIDLVISMSI